MSKILKFKIPVGTTSPTEGKDIVSKLNEHIPFNEDYWLPQKDPETPSESWARIANEIKVIVKR